MMKRIVIASAACCLCAMAALSEIPRRAFDDMLAAANIYRNAGIIAWYYGSRTGDFSDYSGNVTPATNNNATVSADGYLLRGASNEYFKSGVYIDSGRSNITVSLNVKVHWAATTNTEMIIFSGVTSVADQNNGLEFRWRNDGFVRLLRGYNAGELEPYYDAGLGMTNANWQHWTFVSQSETNAFPTAQTYLNGVRISDTAMVTLGADYDYLPILFGYHYTINASRHTYAYVDSVRIYNRALDSNDVHAIYLEDGR